VFVKTIKPFNPPVQLEKFTNLSDILLPSLSKKRHSKKKEKKEEEDGKKENKQSPLE